MQNIKKIYEKNKTLTVRFLRDIQRKSFKVQIEEYFGKNVSKKRTTNKIYETPTEKTIGELVVWNLEKNNNEGTNESKGQK